MSRVHDPHLPVTPRSGGALIPRLPARRPRPGSGGPSARRDGRHEAASTPALLTRPSDQAGDQRAEPADRGIGLLIIFTAGVLVMVALIALTAIIDRWWVLGPVMAIDFAVTAAVLAIIVRLMDE